MVYDGLWWSMVVYGVVSGVVYAGLWWCMGWSMMVYADLWWSMVVFGGLWWSRVLSAAGPKSRSEVPFLLACTSKTTHKGSGTKSRTNLPAPGTRPRHIDFDRPA